MFLANSLLADSMIVSKKRPRIPLLDLILSDEPAARLIRQTARKEWRLIALNLGSSIIDSLSEGCTLAVLFLAIQILTATAGAPFNWGSNPLLNWSPSVARWLNDQPAEFVFIGLLCLAVVLQALQSLMRFFNQVSVGYFSSRCRSLITSRIHSQVLRLSFACASSYKVGDLVDYVNQGGEAIRIQIEQLGALFVNTILCASYLLVMIGISPFLLIAVIILGGLIAVVQRKLLPRLQSGSNHASLILANISALIAENFHALRLLHSSGNLEMAENRLRISLVQLENALKSQSRRLAYVVPFSSLLPTLGIALIGIFSVLILGSRNTGILPSLITFILALQRLTVRLSAVAYSQNILADNSGRLSRLNQILSDKGKDYRRTTGSTFHYLKSCICFQSVSLSYSSDLKCALSNISFTLPKGHILALVGSSGAGKSSIADLLSGLYAPTTGRILIDSTPLDQINLMSWQNRIGVVSQETFLFNCSIYENITFGLTDVSRSRLSLACHAAQISEFIDRLPQGYDTIIGERGYRLSGGQRQRISLARAILRDPELLILDEATSALDTHSERLVQQAIEQFERDHTILIIAHRLSTIVNADEILVMDSGRIIENGSHNKLLTENGLYARLWQQQSFVNSQKSSFC